MPSEFVRYQIDGVRLFGNSKKGKNKMPSIKDYRDSIINQLTMAVDACISEQNRQMDSGNVDINLSTMLSEICFKFNNGSLDIKSKINLDFSKTQLMGTIKTTSSK